LHSGRYAGVALHHQQRLIGNGPMVTIIYSIRSEALENYLEVFGLFSEAER
jgi:hypothetical protein